MGGFPPITPYVAPLILGKIMQIQSKCSMFIAFLLRDFLPAGKRSKRLENRKVCHSATSEAQFISRMECWWYIMIRMVICQYIMMMVICRQSWLLGKVAHQLHSPCTKQHKGWAFQQIYRSIVGGGSNWYVDCQKKFGQRICGTLRPRYHSWFCWMRRNKSSTNISPYISAYQCISIFDIQHIVECWVLYAYLGTFSAYFCIPWYHM